MFPPLILSMGDGQWIKNRSDILAGQINGQDQTLNSSSSVLEAGDVLGDSLSTYLSQLFETNEQAALNQAMRNEAAAVASYERSEAAADEALKRARFFRQTLYQDTVESLKAAGLNPVLAAGGGISGGSSVSPMANTPSSSSGLAEGLNIISILTAISALVSSGGSLLKGISSLLDPTHMLSSFSEGVQNGKSFWNQSYYTYGK